ncbi:MAG: site-specific DNA-methyltransferase, partial [Thermoplasmata archaeon]
MNNNKIKIAPITGRSMLSWNGKKPIEYVEGYPIKLIEILDLFKHGKKVENPSYDILKDDWQNILIHGENGEILATLIYLGYKGKIDLIYIDPPFNSNAKYSRDIKLRGINNKSSLQQIMYSDIWDTDEYLQFIYERLILMRELLSDRGSIYVHCDWRSSGYIRLILDEIFGENNFMNEIIWHYYAGGAGDKGYAKKHDIILFYARNKKNVFFVPQKEKKYVDGKKEGTEKLQNATREWLKDDKGVYTFIIKRDTWYIPIINPLAQERKGYPTQKPEELLKQVIFGSSDEDSIVADFFCGSGTTLAVAEKLNRRWIGSDMNKRAIQITSARLQNVIKDGDVKYPEFSI